MKYLIAILITLILSSVSCKHDSNLKDEQQHRSQVYVDLAVLNWIFPEKELHHYIKQLIRAGFGNRIMYGTDQMVWPEVIDIGIASINSAPLSLEQKENIFFDNAATFLGLSEEEIKKYKNNQ